MELKVSLIVNLTVSLTLHLYLLCKPITLLSSEKTSQFGTFTRFNSGARRQSLGNAYVAVLGDSTSASANPAGIVDVKKLELTAFHAPLYYDVVFNSLNIVYPSRRWGVFGAGWLNISSDSFEKRVNAIDDYTLFEVSEQAGYISYAYQFFNMVSLGASLKTVHHKIDGFSDVGFGADMGTIVSLPIPKNLYCGITVLNIIPPRLTLDAEEEQYQTRVRSGLAYIMPDIFKKYGHDIMFTADIEKQEYPRYHFSSGCEYGWQETLFMRAGFDQGVVSTGLGARFGNYQLDYAASAHDLGLVQKFSVTMKFGYSLAEMELLQGKRFERVTKKDANILSQSYYRIGLQYFDKKQYEEAIDEWEKALIWNPQNKKAEQMLQKTQVLLKDLKEKKELEDHVVLAHAYYADKKWSDALHEWDKVIEIDPAHKDAQYYIRDIKDKIAISSQERENYKQKKEMNTKGIISQLNQEGWRQYQNGNYTEAINIWKKIFSHEYENKTALENISKANRAIDEEIKKHFDQGKTYYDSSLTAKAIDEFKKVLKFDPGHNDAARYLELCRKQAIEQKRHMSINPQTLDQLYFKAADLYLKNEYDKTLVVLDDILKQDPTNENAMNLKEKTESAMDIVRQ